LFQVVIDGNEFVILVKVTSFLNSYTFQKLVDSLKSRGYNFSKRYRHWYKLCSNLEQLDREMNELENFLIDNDIVFVNRHSLFKALDLRSFL